MDHQKQPYDASLKGLIRAQVAEMLQYLIEGATFVGELNTEVFKPHPPLRTDEAFKIFYRGQIHIYHLELEMRGSRKMPHRMLSYHSLLYEEHEHPVISMIMYPFRTTLPESPFREMSGGQELLRLHFRVLPLWELRAERYVDEHAVVMYPLLPTMQGANAKMMIQAIQELIVRYNGEELSRRLVWFRTLMQRVETLPNSDKNAVEEHLAMFEELLEEDPYIRKLKARAEAKGEVEGRAKGEAEGRAKGEAEGRAKGEAEGRAEGQTQAMRGAVMNVIQARFPNLSDFAQEKVPQISKVEVLNTLVARVATAPDEETVLLLLNSLAA